MRSVYQIQELRI